MNKKLLENIIKENTPTEEQMIETAKSWWEHHEGISFLSYSDKLKEHTMPFSIQPLSRELSEMIMEAAWSGQDKETVFSELRDIIEAGMRELPDLMSEDIFVKTISRSGKDATDNDSHGKPQPQTVQSAITSLLGSTRVFDDLGMLRFLPQNSLVIRPYVVFDASQEWRVFVKDKEIAGISQYYYTEDFKYTRLDVSNVKAKIASFINKAVIPEISVDSFVADVILNKECVLLETNPYGLSDPCLFGDYDSMDGTLRVKKLSWNMQ